MKRIVVASTHKEAGKTSLMIGIAKALSKKDISCGYMKPLGDRLLYQKKRLWDYDASLVSSILDLKEKPEDISLGFDHSKLRFMYDEQSTSKKLKELCDKVSKDHNVVLIEGGENLASGHSVYLDPITIANSVDAQLLLILSGEGSEIADEIGFLRKCVLSDPNILAGVIINQVRDIEEFNNIYMEIFDELEIPVLGIIPYEDTLAHFTIDYLYKTLFTKVIAGEGGLMNVVNHIFVGAMSAAQVTSKPLWQYENKLIITPGDRVDMITAALDSSTAGIVLTNNILPDDPIIHSKADARNIPILLATNDTFAVAKLIDDMEILFTKDEIQKINILEELVKEHVNLDFLN
ncbi:MAG: AAA family ATPase [Candidatus Hodarchaeales archaeon]|jgi:BioD-like phosphotransacetylase family protein